MNKKIIFVILIIIVLGITSLIIYTNFIKENLRIKKSDVIKFINLESGFYGIIGDDGKNYQPINLSNEFKVDGMKIKFEGRLRKKFINNIYVGRASRNFKG
ncbi:MAG: hypothetical protein ACPLN1_06005 [Caldisericia bacterium]